MKTCAFRRKHTSRSYGEVHSHPCSLFFLLKLVYEKADGGSLENAAAIAQQCLQSLTPAPASQGSITTRAVEQQNGISTSHFRLNVAELEEISILFLSNYSRKEEWREIISSRNQFGQTLAHISVMLGYLKLLQHLITWEINLDLTDLTGSTALHYAFLCNKGECAICLILSGAKELARDELGRSPWDLNPSLIDDVTSRLRGVSKIDGSFSVSCQPVDNECETEPEEAAVLRAKYLLVQRWQQQMEEEQHSTDSWCGGQIPRLGTSPACLPSSPGYKNGKKIQLNPTRCWMLV
jgi:hypothetical protein